MAAYFLVAAWPALTGEYVTNNDAPQHLLWMFDVSWGEPFYGDTSGVIQPWGYRGFNALLLYFFSPYALSNWGPLFTLLFTVCFVYAGLRTRLPLLLACLGALLVGHFGYPPMVGYFARAFCLPVLAVFFYGWMRDDPRVLGGAAVFGALFYPPAMLIGLGIIGLWQLGKIGEWPSLMVLLIGVGLALSIAFAKNGQLRSHPWIGDFFPAEVITNAPEFTYDGRVNFVHELKTTTFEMFRYTFEKHGQLPGGKWTFYLVQLICIVVALRDWKKPIHRLDTFLGAFLLSAALLHFLAQVLVPRLFLPDRFLSYPGAFLTGLLLIRIAATLKSNFLNKPIVLLSLSGMFMLWLPLNRKIRGESLDNYAYLREVYEGAAALPEGSLVAAPPWAADNIPYFAQRSVLLSNESAHALYFQEYHAFIDRRWRDFLPAYAARAGQERLLLDFLRRYRVTHLLVDRINLADGNFFTFEPYAGLYRNLTEGRKREDYLLLQLPRTVGRALTERYQLVSSQELEAYFREK